MKPKIIHTKTFSCADDHPIVWYTFDETNKALCGYCAAQFVYEPKEERTPLPGYAGQTRANPLSNARGL